jgi:hypothetical protein
MAAGVIATAWYPDSYHPWGMGLALGASHLGFTTAGHIFREFEPDLRRLLRH